MRQHWWIALLVLGAIAIVSAALGSTATTDDPDPILEFDFDEDSVIYNAVIDESGADNHGEIVGETERQPVVTDDSMHFDGNHAVVIDLEERTLEDDFTVVAEVKNGYHGYFAGIVTSEAWWVVAREDRYGFYTPERGIASEDGADETWTHVTAVYRDGTFELYVDGEFVDERDISEDLSTDRIYVGQRPNGYPLEGEIAAVQVYDRAVSSGEVNALYDNRPWVPAFFYSDEFRFLNAIALVLVAFAAAWYEVTSTNG